MRGPATDDECIQIPADVDLGLAFLAPDDIADPERLTEPMAPVSAETIAGSDTTHYTLRSVSVAGWQDMELDIWLDVSSGAAVDLVLAVAKQRAAYVRQRRRFQGRPDVHDRP